MAAKTKEHWQAVSVYAVRVAKRTRTRRDAALYLRRSLAAAWLSNGEGWSTVREMLELDSADELWLERQPR